MYIYTKMNKIIQASNLNKILHQTTRKNVNDFYSSVLQIAIYTFCFNENDFKHYFVAFSGLNSTIPCA